MKKIILFLIFTPIYLLITFFGLGPVLLADGSTQERMFTLLVVLGLYFVITIILIYIVKRKKS